jgi:hypothetical protein
MNCGLSQLRGTMIPHRFLVCPPVPGANLNGICVYSYPCISCWSRYFERDFSTEDFIRQKQVEKRREMRFES